MFQAVMTTEYLLAGTGFEPSRLARFKPVPYLPPTPSFRRPGPAPYRGTCGPLALRLPEMKNSKKLERTMGVEPTTFSLATKRSTSELRPHCDKVLKDHALCHNIHLTPGWTLLHLSMWWPHMVAGAGFEPTISRI